MYIAMNRFKIAEGREADFIEIWKNRDTFLETVPGFKKFNLMQGPKIEGENGQPSYTLFASHSEWEDQQAFEDWTKSEAFRKAHANAGNVKSEGIYLGPPQFEGFSSVL